MDYRGQKSEIREQKKREDNDRNIQGLDSISESIRKFAEDTQKKL